MWQDLIVARSPQDENLGGQKHAKMSGEILARRESWQPKMCQDEWQIQDHGEKNAAGIPSKMSVAKNALRY